MGPTIEYDREWGTFLNDPKTLWRKSTTWYSEIGWISALHTELATNTTTYYGHPDDIGAPGIKSGGALPVTLSHFRAERTDTGVVVKWTTESELNNAGFNILRSETKNGEFKVINLKGIISGHGTTNERHTYTWTDITAKPNVAYYYRIEDISHAGVRKPVSNRSYERTCICKR